jgi:hypothetical protein
MQEEDEFALVNSAHSDAGGNVFEVESTTRSSAVLAAD